MASQISWNNLRIEGFCRERLLAELSHGNSQPIIISNEEGVCNEAYGLRYSTDSGNTTN